MFGNSLKTSNKETNHLIAPCLPPGAPKKTDGLSLIYSVETES